jgi:ADP-heptose:LPS heptosyltransferase
MPTHPLAARFPVVFAYNGGIGDRLCNLPALRALESAFPDRLSLVCGKRDRQLYYSDLDLHAVHELELEQTNVGWEFDAEALTRLIGDCDLVLCINPWHTASVSDLLSRLPAAESIGFFPEFQRHIQCDYHGHAIDMAFAVPAFLNSALKLSDFSQPPSISAMASAMAEEFRRLCAGSQRTLFVHTDTRQEKSWPLDRFRLVLHHFLRDFPEFTAFVVDLHGEEIRRGRFPDRVVPVSLPLDASFALLRSCDLFLGIDSCHLHAADLFRVPGVGLFGPTTSRRWGFRFSNHTHVQGNGSMDAVEVADVCRAMQELAREVRTGGQAENRGPSIGTSDGRSSQGDRTAARRRVCSTLRSR